MKEGDYIKYKYKHEIKSGKIIKIYKEIGGKNHGKEFAIILDDNNQGLFNANTVRIETFELINNLIK